MLNKLKVTVRKNREYRKLIHPPFTQSQSTDSDSDSDLDNLVAELDKIKLQPNLHSDSIEIMSEINYSEVRLFLDIIPCFNGEPCELNNFLAACDDVVLHYATNQTLTKLIFRAILGKLKGKALIIISSRTELNTWTEVRFILKQTFTDQRSFNCLLQELHSIKPHPKESSYSFGVRCQYLRSLINSSINNDNTLSQEQKSAQILNIEGLVVITFQKYLPTQIQLAIRLKNPRNLEEALQYLIEEENFLSIVNESRFKHPVLNGNRNFNNFLSGIPMPSIQTPIFQNQPPPSTPRPFPSQPIAINPKPTSPQRYFTNEQVFGKPRNNPNVNVWKPRGNTNQPRPIPMSVVTKQTVPRQYPGEHSKFTQKPNYFQSHFQPRSKPTFTSEELYSIDNFELEYFDEIPENTHENFEEINEQTQNYCDENIREITNNSHDESSSQSDYQNFPKLAFPTNPT